MIGPQDGGEAVEADRMSKEPDDQVGDLRRLFEGLCPHVFADGEGGARRPAVRQRDPPAEGVQGLDPTLFVPDMARQEIVGGTPLPFILSYC